MDPSSLLKQAMKIESPSQSENVLSKTTKVKIDSHSDKTESPSKLEIIKKLGMLDLKASNSTPEKLESPLKLDMKKLEMFNLKAPKSTPQKVEEKLHTTVLNSNQPTTEVEKLDLKSQILKALNVDANPKTQIITNVQKNSPKHSKTDNQASKSHMSFKIFKPEALPNQPDLIAEKKEHNIVQNVSIKEKNTLQNNNTPDTRKKDIKIKKDMFVPTSVQRNAAPKTKNRNKIKNNNQNGNQSSNQLNHSINSPFKTLAKRPNRIHVSQESPKLILLKKEKVENPPSISKPLNPLAKVFESNSVFSGINIKTISEIRNETKNQKDSSNTSSTVPECSPPMPTFLPPSEWMT